MAKVRLDNISKKVMHMQVGISTAKLGRVICSRDDETVFIKTIKTGKGYAKIRVTEKLWLKQNIFHGLRSGAAPTRLSNYYLLIIPSEREKTNNL